MRVHVLGQVRATVDGRPLRLGGAKQRLVLATLVVRRGDAVPVRRLMQDVWGDDRPATARRTLQGYVSHLRATLGRGRPDRRRGVRPTQRFADPRTRT